MKPTPVPGGTYERFAVLRNAWVEVTSALSTPALEVVGGSVIFLDSLSGSFTSLRMLEGGAVDLRKPWGFADGMNVEISGTNAALRVMGGTPMRLSALKVSGSGATLAQNLILDGQLRTLELDVSGPVEVGAGATIDVSGAGYLGGWQGVNVVQSGRTTGNVPSQRTSAGGSHGGHGAVQSGTAAIPVYGDYRNPSDFGSGGAGNSSGSLPGGNGAGVLRLSADSLVLNGKLLANGEDAYSPYGVYAGAGGSIRVQANALTGSGAMEAVGGAYGLAAGGRIAVYFDTATSSFSWSNITARGALYYPGGPGTVYLKGSLEAYGDLIIDNANLDTNPQSVAATDLLLPSSTGEQTFRNLTITRKSSVTTPDALTFTGTLTVDSSSRLQSSNLNLP
ncbi:hypothetical protein HMI49_25610 [Corallococcus exercitus]|uniref:Uncharacterized protein n=1 Tax=Corallococcus exercitus TaxID=2316736 RepID=A0A7Y4NT80_9BACT|nr:hypothetical protein [Corallococcus exercitus]